MGTYGRVLSKCHNILEKQIIPIVQWRKLTSPIPVVQGRQLASPIAEVKFISTSSSRSVRKYIPRRAVLYVPGNDEKKLRKIPSLNVDCAVLDCEDGVAINRKEEARSTIVTILNEMDFGRTECVVRVNSVDSGLMEEDLKVLFRAEQLPGTIMLPKVDREDQIDSFTEILKEITKDRPLKNKLKLITFVESAFGLINLKYILRKAVNMSLKEKLYELEGVVFGSDDYIADIGARKTHDSKEMTYVRQKVVALAKAFRLQAIDMVHNDYKDLEGLKAQAEEGAILGFTGKQVIHPGQVEIVQEAFSPSPERVREATQLIKAFNIHQQKGQGAFTYRGTMIDMPLVLQAKNTLQLAEAVK